MKKINITEYPRLWNFLPAILIAFFSLLNCFLYEVKPGVEVPTEGSIVYAGEQENLFDRCYDNIKTPKNIKESYDYVIVDYNYNFGTMNDYEKIGTYATPLILAVKDLNIPDSITFSYEDFIDAAAWKNDWSEIGVKSLNMNEVKACIPYDHQTISNAIYENQGNNKENYFNYNVYKRPKDNVVNIIWKPNLAHMEGFREVNIEDSSHEYLVFDVYKNKDYETEEDLNIPYMNKVSDDMEFETAGQDYRDILGREKWDNPHAWKAILWGAVSAMLFLSGIICYYEKKSY